MRRREFIILLGGAVAAWPFAASAQQRRGTPVVGYLDVASPEPNAFFLAALRRGLTEIGYVEGQNVAFELRWAEGRTERLPALADELVRRQVAVIVTGGIPAAQAAKAATTNIPIVFLIGVDPVKFDLVDSLARPGGNVTGVNFLNRETDGKRLGLLHDLVPQTTLIAVLRNPTRADAAEQLEDVQNAARMLGKQLLILNASTGSEIDTGFATLAQRRAHALFVVADAFMTTRREHIVALAARHALPAIYSLREFAAAGGLISYAASITDAWRQAGVLARGSEHTPFSDIFRMRGGLLGLRRVGRLFSIQELRSQGEPATFGSYELRLACLVQNVCAQTGLHRFFWRAA